MKELEIDIETRSDRDITKCSVYAYADSPYFAVTLFSVSVDGGEVVLYDLASGEKIPDEILRALADESIVKRAFNVNFERVCLSRYLRDNYPQYFRSYSIDADTVSDYHYYDTAEYPDNAALSLEDAGVNDTVIFAAFQGEPMLPLHAADHALGDLDNSGKLDILDVITINKSILGIKALSKAAQKAADLNGDGRTDADDSLRLLKMVLDIQ